MKNLAIAEEYIENVPWQDNPSFAFGNDSQKYQDAFRRVIECVPNTENKIMFNSDIWDFRPLFKGINSKSYKIIFRADDDYKDYLKFFVIYTIGRRTKISTACRNVGNYIEVISSVKKNTNHKDFSLITTEDIINNIEERDVKSSRYSALYSSVYRIYSFIVKNYKVDLPIDIKVLEEKALHYSRRTETDSDKIPNIPEEYYQIIIRKAVEVMNDETQSLRSRMTAGAIVVLSQTGLRRQDLAGIKITDLKEKRLPVSDVTCNYLHFQSRKPSKAHSALLEFDIIASPLCVDAINKMIQVRTDCEFAFEPYLYVLPSSGKSSSRYPVTGERLELEYKRFFYDYLFDETQREWDGIHKSVFVANNSKNNRVRVTMNVPTISQFRVHLATALYNNGISLTYIQRYLGHLSEYMLGYYVRKKDNSVENSAYAERIVQKIAGEKETPLGNMGEALRDNLVRFVEDGNYNVKTDAAQVLKDLGERLVIREKGPGLCCIKTSIIPCKNDARTNEILCAYGMCPNIFHFYDMLNVTYMQFHALQETYQENLDNGFARAAQKELNKLKDFIRRRLMPELKELGRVLEKTSIDDFCAEHPDLAMFARNYDQIIEEVKQWETY